MLELLRQCFIVLDAGVVTTVALACIFSVKPFDVEIQKLEITTRYILMLFAVAFPSLHLLIPLWFPDLSLPLHIDYMPLLNVCPINSLPLWFRCPLMSIHSNNSVKGVDQGMLVCTWCVEHRNVQHATFIGYPVPSY
jgi:hypothetical protein